MTEGKDKQMWKHVTSLFHRRQKPPIPGAGHMQTPLPGADSRRLPTESPPAANRQASPEACMSVQSSSPAGVTPPPQSVPPATPRICLAFRGHIEVLLKVDLGLLLSRGPCHPLPLPTDETAVKMGCFGSCDCPVCPCCLLRLGQLVPQLSPGEAGALPDPAPRPRPHKAAGPSRAHAVPPGPPAQEAPSAASAERRGRRCTEASSLRVRRPQTRAPCC